MNKAVIPKMDSLKKGDLEIRLGLNKFRRPEATFKD